MSLFGHLARFWAFQTRSWLRKGAQRSPHGRSRGGLTTKLHLRVIGNGLPVQIELSPGQMNDQPMAELLLNELPAGAEVIADKGYDADWIRNLIEDQDCTPHIPPKSNRYDGITYSKAKYNPHLDLYVCRIFRTENRGHFS
jgi:transposase